MPPVLRFYLGGSLLVLFATGCSNELLEPTADAASFAGSGSKVNAPSSTRAVGLSPSQIDVTWQDNSGNETGFEVHTGTGNTFTLLASVGAGITQYIPGRLTALTQYCYKVRAFRTAGSKNSYSTFSNTACGTTLAPVAPGPPFSAWSRPTNSTTVEVSWSDTSSNEDGFRVERSTDGGTTFALAATTGPNQESFVKSFIDGDRITEGLVCYRVVAFNSVGDSPPKTAGCSTPLQGPSNLTAARSGPQTVALSWRDRTGLEWGYELQRSTEEAGPFATVAKFQTWGLGTVSYSDTVPTSGVYWYRTRAVTSGDGFSDFSNTAGAAGDAVPPNSPGPVEAQPFATYLEVGWGDNAINEQGFRIERSTDGGSIWVAAGMNGPNDQSFYEQWSATEVEVCYRIFAFNEMGSSPPSPVACTALPATPGPLTFTFVDDNTVGLVWTDNSSFEDGYEVWGSYCGGGFHVLGELAPNETTLRVSGVATDGYYRFLVRARKGRWGYSYFSNEVWPYPDACQF
jgi:hypothetical protein